MNLLQRAVVAVWDWVKAMAQWLPIIAIQAGTMWGATFFNMAHGAFPWFVATSVSGGIEASFIFGLYYASKTQSRLGQYLIYIGAFTSTLYSFLYLLIQYNVIPQNPNLWWSIGLSVAHIGPLFPLMILYANIKHEYNSKMAEDEAKALADSKIQETNAISRAEELANQEHAIKMRKLEAALAFEEEQNRLRLELAKRKAEAEIEANTAKVKAEIKAMQPEKPAKEKAKAQAIVGPFTYKGIEYQSMEEAVQATGVTRQAISAWVHRNRKKEQNNETN